MSIKIEKSEGFNESEKFLIKLCDKTFLKMWSYPNTFKSKGDELCDLLAVFENHVFIFCDKHIKFNTDKEIMIAWNRWGKEAIEKQIYQARKARKHILKNPSEIYLDAKCTKPLPIKIPAKDLVFHLIIVANGAKEACENSSENNVSGSLGAVYGESLESSISDVPFLVELDKNDPIHVFDEHNLEIILRELDTFYDFMSYLTEKEEAIRRHLSIIYCGEEDLLAHYFINYDDSKKKYKIGVNDKEFNAVFIGEGEWNDFAKSEPYKRRLEANKLSYLWDEMIQKTCQNAFDGTLLGDGIFDGKSALYEMAKESRLARRSFANKIRDSIIKFPENVKEHQMVRHMFYMQSMYDDKGYVFLQIKHSINTDDEIRGPFRQKMLEIACGAAKNKFLHLKKVIGIAIDAPKYNYTNSEDFLLMNCEKWSDKDRKFYDDLNKELKFFESGIMQDPGRINDFPSI